MLRESKGEREREACEAAYPHVGTHRDLTSRSLIRSAAGTLGRLSPPQLGGRGATGTGRRDCFLCLLRLQECPPPPTETPRVRHTGSHVKAPAGALPGSLAHGCPPEGR